MHQQNQQLHALLEISRIVFRHLGRDILLSQVASEGKILLESDGCYIDLLTDDSRFLKTIASSDSAFAPQVEAYPLKLGDGVIGKVALSGQGCITNNIHLREDAYQVPHTPENNPQNLLAVPMKSKEGILGVISVARFGDQAMHHYTQEDYTYLESLANILTLNLEYMRLVEMQQKQRAAKMVLEQMNLVGAFLAHKIGGLLGARSLAAQELLRQIQPTDSSTVELLDSLVTSSRTASRIIDQFS